MKLRLTFCGACTMLDKINIIAYQFAYDDFYAKEEREEEFKSGTQQALKYIKR